MSHVQWRHPPNPARTDIRRRLVEYRKKDRFVDVCAQNKIFVVGVAWHWTRIHWPRNACRAFPRSASQEVFRRINFGISYGNDQVACLPSTQYFAKRHPTRPDCRCASSNRAKQCGRRREKYEVAWLVLTRSLSSSDLSIILGIKSMDGQFSRSRRHWVIWMWRSPTVSFLEHATLQNHRHRALCPPHSACRFPATSILLHAMDLFDGLGGQHVVGF